MSCGGRHTAAVTEDGLVYTWGWGGGGFLKVGGLGHGYRDSISSPKVIEALKNIKAKQVACGDKHTLVLTGLVVLSFFVLFCWILFFFYFFFYCEIAQ